MIIISKSKIRLGTLLIQNNIISKQQLNEALDKQKYTNKKLGEVLIDLGFASEDEVMLCLKQQLDIDIVDINSFDLHFEAINKITESLAKKYNLIPLKLIDSRHIMVAMSNPLDILALEDIEIITSMKPIPILAKSKDIDNAINKYYGDKKTILLAEEFEKEVENRKSKYAPKFENNKQTSILNSPAVKLINTVIHQAVIKNASDIHIEPFETYIRIRFRIDGLLQEIFKTDIATLSGIVARIKILANMNIAEKRLPQDGRIMADIENNKLDLRISVLPTLYGEKVVIRIIYCTNIDIDKGKIGFLDHDLNKFNKLISETKNGIILITGPTGSGKSTTLASIMKQLNTESLNLVTVENPVENTLDGVNQVNVNFKTGLDFPEVLRSILRQDPDIIMVGEIRDTQTADIAIRAAITGHLVFSTLHTNDAVSSISRLIDMGIERYMIASSLRGVIAQRLMREVCICSQYETISYEEASLFNIPFEMKVKKAVGCKYCNYTGYKGRFAVNEIFIINSNIRQLISTGYEEENLKKIAFDNGMMTLKDNALKNVINGRTTLNEFYRVIYSEY